MRKKVKTIIKIIVILVILLLIVIFSLSYMINKNNNYQEEIIKNIEKNYNISNITYANVYNTYYILTTKDNVIVLDKEYKEVLKEKTSILANNSNNYQLIYKNKKLIYEETILKDNKVIYTYYDAKTNKKINTTELEQ